MSFDFIIVGAGAAGSVLANRLSQRSDRRVLLIEAGPDITPGREPDDVKAVFPLSVFNPGYMWPDTRVHWRRADNSPNVPLPQGKILGGSSTVMGMWALRGRPEDYDEWRDAGAEGWSWEEVLPYFNRLETDADFEGPLHGQDGPIPIRREPLERWSDFARATFDEVTRRGWAHIEDLNGDFADGHCAMPNSRFADSRGAAGVCYLTAEVRQRPNLEVLTDCTVQRLLIEGTQVRGVVYRRAHGPEQQALATETLLTAGALRTPVLLLRSGIGAERALRSLEIPVAANVPGVGQSLQNHAVLYVNALLKRGTEEVGLDRPAAATYLRWSSTLPGCAPGDMAIYVRSYLSWHALGRRMASLAPALQRPLSRGQVTLDPRDPAGAPNIEFNMLSARPDLTRLLSGLELAVDLFGSASLRRLCGEPFVMNDPARIMRYNAHTSRNALLARAATTLLDLYPAGGRALLRRTAATRDAGTLIGNHHEAEDFVREQVTGTGHVCGTCRMGRDSDPLAVCDSGGRVRGLRQLRVADASLMPSVPSGNTHLPVVMVAEKIAADILHTSTGVKG